MLVVCNRRVQERDLKKHGADCDDEAARGDPDVIWFKFAVRQDLAEPLKKLEVMPACIPAMHSWEIIGALMNLLS